jgi:hypothetical protein
MRLDGNELRQSNTTIMALFPYRYDGGHARPHGSHLRSVAT